MAKFSNAALAKYHSTHNVSFSVAATSSTQTEDTVQVDTDDNDLPPSALPSKSTGIEA